MRMGLIGYVWANDFPKVRLVAATNAITTILIISSPGKVDARLPGTVRPIYAIVNETPVGLPVRLAALLE